VAKVKQIFLNGEKMLPSLKKSGYEQCNFNINTNKPLFTERDDPFDVLGFSHHWKSHGFQWQRLRK